MIYQALFKVQIRHSYFENGICPDLRISPDAATEKLLKGHRLILRENYDGIVVLAPIVEATNSILIALAPGTTLSFLLQPNDSGFNCCSVTTRACTTCFPTKPLKFCQAGIHFFFL